MRKIERACGLEPAPIVGRQRNLSISVVAGLNAVRHMVRHRILSNKLYRFASVRLPSIAYLKPGELPLTLDSPKHALI